MARLSVHDYFDLPETLQPSELVHGTLVREPMPVYGHQLAVARLTALLYEHVEVRGIGVCLPGIDVVLDRDAPLVVQPDVLVVLKERFHVIGERIWGAPDLVVEVLSPKTARRDQTTKLDWYRTYGVRECWFVSNLLQREFVEVIDLQAVTVPRRLSADDRLRSYVLPELDVPADHIFS